MASDEKTDDFRDRLRSAIRQAEAGKLTRHGAGHFSKLADELEEDDDAET